MRESSLSGGIAAIVGARRAQATTMCAAVLTIAAAALDVPEARAANTFLVTTTGDPGPMGTQSLRQAIALANTGDTVQFDASLNGSTITLQGGEIPISKGGVTIHGPGSDKLTVSGNDASRIFNIALGSYSSTKIDGLTLTHGNAGNGLYGGAIAATNSHLSLDGARIEQSTATYGGALSLVDTSAQLIHCVIVGNSADQYGGGVSFTSINHYRFIDIRISTISGNSSNLGGGVFFLAGDGNTSSFSIAYSTISGNRADASGGGLLLATQLGTAGISNSTIAENYAYVRGGGAVIFSGQTHVGVSTVAANSTHVGAGNGLYISSAAAVSLLATIVANNFSGATSSDFFGDFHADYSLLKNIGQSSVTGSNNLIGADPKLGTLADHGGWTTTMVPSASSPVIDAAGKASSSVTDQRSLVRPVGAGSDIGAVELQQAEDVIFGSDFSFCTEVQKC